MPSICNRGQCVTGVKLFGSLITSGGISFGGHNVSGDILFCGLLSRVAF